MWQLLLLLVAVFRLVTPLYLSFYPFEITLASLFLDAVDGYLAFRARWSHHAYHMYDKTMDYWWYVGILLFATDLPIFPVIFILFVYRTVGQIVSIALYKPLTLAWFPNILENYFIAYLMTWMFPSWSTYFIDKNQIYPLVICGAVAIIREYIIHIRKITIGNYFGLKFHWEKNGPRR
ncbi:hypothetical protein A2973_04095 [Candidatus Gottesmanbacteria bacterium RIFCSPLOWO2_01_FULL_49_10]|uniref:CDP-alcohol phosphatidyltransferase n=1 Tax=Candidatus Gottesmanbacteria bacterium RIFCSPLOWO2_01_FULL_49_10 TaxID=1798396 RepID=A0A1F6B0R6_9BACT|nr:MAG: hypothetical protein A2973_04095 [Candidatus Gottesmanbacteria bacterium RIFCSPLOWO2_01_FULL_49_10]